MARAVKLVEVVVVEVVVVEVSDGRRR